MKAIFENNPFLRLVLPFILGIYGGLCLHFVNELHSFYVLIFSVLLFVVLQLSQNFRRSNWINYLLIFIFFNLGYYQSSSNLFEPIEFQKKEIIAAQLLEYPDSTTNALKVKVRFLGKITDSLTAPLQGNAIIYFSKCEKAENLAPGSYIIFKGKPQQISNRGNPFEFNYKSWAANNHIYYGLFVKGDDWFVKQNSAVFSLQFELKKIRRKLLNYYKRSGITHNELSVFSALTLGDKTMLNGDLKEGYAAAGLMHILAVSGLHVGIIYLVIRLLCRSLLRSRYGKVLRFVILILVLWGYATLTGLSPSVTRAATMFSVFAMGDLLGRKYAIYNSIGLAAFILLFYDPFLIYNVGFQMSFLAVIGIVVFYPLIYKWIYVPNKWLDKIWQLIAVSIAAQLITAPLGLYYFHQFPVLFLLSNLLMIPLATVLMYLFVAMMVTIPFPVISSKIGWCISHLTQLMNDFTGWVKDFKWATYQSGSFDILQVVMLYGLIGFITYWGIRTTYRNLRTVMLIAITFVSYNTINSYILQKENHFIAFNTYDQPLWLLTSGDKYCIGNPDKSEEIDRYLNPVLRKLGIDKEVENNISQFEISFFGKGQYNGVFYNSDFFPRNDTIKCRWLLLSENAPGDISKITCVFNPTYIIADATVPSYKLNYWRKMLAKSGKKVYSLLENGAFFETWPSNNR